MVPYDNEENAVVNNAGGVSETPSNLVGFNFKPGEIVSQDELDKILQYKKDGNPGESKLTPNPAGFGFTSQEFVDTLPNVASGKPNVLYIVKVKNDGVVVGYRLYKYIPFGNGQDAHYAQFGATPDLELEKGEQKQEAVENNPPRKAPEKVFEGDVVFGGDIYYKGKKIIQREIDGNTTIDEIDSKGQPEGKIIVSNGTGGASWENPLSVKANEPLSGEEEVLEALKINGSNYQLPFANADGIQFNFATNPNYTLSASNNYASYLRAVGKVLFFVVSFNITKDTIGTGSDPITIGSFNSIPNDIFNKLVADNFLDQQNTRAFIDGTFNSVVATTALVKNNDNSVSLQLETTNLVNNTTYHIRHISVFLLSDNFYHPRGCAIANLGNATPSNVTFSKSANFPTEAQCWEEVTIGSDKFAKFTPWYKKPIYNGNELIGFEISNVKEDDSYKIYDCFLDEDGNELPYILIGEYYCTNSSAASSVSGTAATMTIGAARELCAAKGAGYQQMDASMFLFWRDLALAVSQQVNFNNGSGVANFLGLKEMTQGGWWIDGLAHVDNKYLYCGKPSKYVDQPTNATDGYSELAYDMPTLNGGCISKLGYDSNHPTVNFPSAAVSNSSYNTYYCDGVYYDSGNRPCYVNVGVASAGGGLFFLSGNDAWSYARRVRLCFKPTIQ